MWVLRELPFGARLGLTGLVLVLAAGFVASGQYLIDHHAPRDQKEGFSFDDLVGVYHGLDRPSALVGALERDHPPELDPAQRETLLAWLRGDSISDDYDNLDLGDAAPAEIIDRNCVSCHGRGSDDPIGETIPLEYWDDIKAVAYSYHVAPLPEEILLVTTHTHALSLGTVGIALALLALGTSFSRRLIGVLIAVLGLGLFVDLASWWWARENVVFVRVLVWAGWSFAAAAAALILLILADLWLPRRRV